MGGPQTPTARRETARRLERRRRTSTRPQLPPLIAKLTALTQALSARKDLRRFGSQVTAASREGVDRRGTDTIRGTCRVAGTVKSYRRGCRTFYARRNRGRFQTSFCRNQRSFRTGRTSPCRVFCGGLAPYLLTSGNVTRTLGMLQPR